METTKNKALRNWKHYEGAPRFNSEGDLICQSCGQTLPYGDEGIYKGMKQNIDGIVITMCSFNCQKKLQRKISPWDFPPTSK